MSPRLAPALLAAVLVTTACSGGLSRPQRSADGPNELRELKARVLELQRKATVNEVELARLRERVAELEARLGIAAPPPAAAVPSSGAAGATQDRVAEPPLAPSVPEPVEASPPRTARVVIEESDLPVEAPPARPPATPPSPRPAAPPPPAAAPAPAGGGPISPAAQALYDRAYTLYHQGKYLDAESTFQRFLQSHPDTDLTDNAQFWIGEARFARGDLQGALAAFRETVERYPAGNKVADALLKAGQCLEGLGDLEGARASYREVIERFPGSAAGAVAEERLERLP